ncbi:MULTISPECIES: hypothetical protein [Pseudomonas]|jgi:hypothetical protein|uniref:Phage-related protein n=1 Tax=Pseudomonas putida (strain ATCC 47054 / DSM 6125 / CFBP 8728 / NCIMB 11950 / KT2440) TaxID=160488 RepID=Q88MN3_PSEPK|nr:MULTISPECIES: hypothetical protein [Pseudomonas]AAN67159.1 conserved protein of unknown function [Pseudomonas putida KT2440]KMU95665.1 hypothetical protein AC138_13675 [Pseudomonas putida]KMY36348.1 hypothetical protein AA993_07915 [Pseudomonas putida]MDD2078617.1 hypothetical protein [Pseudomonas putida]PXZ52389.1 hypothetical protein DM483_06680 [Pseudomonas sp. SMT-1]
MSQAKERPILFSGPMVRAILEGRKTVTRRPVKPGFPSSVTEVFPYAGAPHVWMPALQSGEPWYEQVRECPYGRPGDRLWVRETWGVISHDFDQQGNRVDWDPDRPAKAIREMRFGRGYYSGHIVYAADGPCEWAGDEDGVGDPRSAWKPSIHMPRVAGRILLEVTDVRVERLQDGEGETDFESRYVPEGINRIHHGDGEHYYHPFKSDPGPGNWADPFDAWRELWVSINGADSWNANPWVWVVEFKRIQP